MADRHRDRVLKIGRQFVQKQHQRVAAEQLFPGFGAGRAGQRCHVAGELVGLAKLLGNGPPNATRRIGAAAVEADHTAAAQPWRGVFVGQHLAAQVWVTR